MILCNEFTTVVHAFLLTFAFAFASRRNVIVCTKRRPAIDGSHSTLEARCNKKKKGKYQFDGLQTNACTAMPHKRAHGDTHTCSCK